MRGIDEAVQEADRQRLDPLGAHELDLLAPGGFIQRQQQLAFIVQAFLHRQAPAPRHQRLRQLDIQVVLVVAAFVAECQDVAEAFRRQQRGLRTLALDDGVGRQRGAVDQQFSTSSGVRPAF